MLKKLTNKKGFTLMEMLIVVAIIAVLVAIAIPTFNGALTKSKEAADVANIRAAYAEYQVQVIGGDTSVSFDKPSLNYDSKYELNDKTITYKADKLADNNGSKTFTWVLGDTLS